MLPKDEEKASKFTAKITVVHTEPRKLTYEGPVLSMDDLPDMNSDQAGLKYWVLPFDAIRTFFCLSRNGENNSFWDVKLIIKAEVHTSALITMNSSKKRKIV